jgi:hypothetical protein
MHFIVHYRTNDAPCGQPDHAVTVQQARLLAPEGRKFYGANTSIIVGVHDDGKEEIVETIKLEGWGPVLRGDIFSSSNWRLSLKRPRTS